MKTYKKQESTSKLDKRFQWMLHNGCCTMDAAQAFVNFIVGCTSVC